MKKNILMLLLFISSVANTQELPEQKKLYVVRLKQNDEVKTINEIEENHHAFLTDVTDNEEEARGSLIYSYKNLNGFAVLLSEKEANKLMEKEDVISMFPSQNKWSLQTTRSQDFLWLEEGLTTAQRIAGLKEANYGENFTVGLLDSGIWPESDSFTDHEMENVPQSWKGICQEGDSFNNTNCNRKIIGARYYLKGYEQLYGPLNISTDYRSPRDHDGHGSHTSSIVAGRMVPISDSSTVISGGVASGGAPLARIAMYKVCWPIPNQILAFGNTCTDVDMLAAIDDAIADGVDIISISIAYASDSLPPLTQDGISLGALHAVKNGIMVVCSAGNSGPYPSTVSNVAPWIFTVGASSIDRDFYSPVILGNGMTIQGKTLTSYALEDKFYPLIFASDALDPNVPQTNETASGQCLPGTLSPEKVTGRIVLCLRGLGSRLDKGKEVKRAGGAAMILGNSEVQGTEFDYDNHRLPATQVDFYGTTAILRYIQVDNNPVAKIDSVQPVLGIKPSPFVARFSSRGPSSVEPNILKPDVVAPGLNILAAWSEVSSPTKFPDDPRRVKYNIISGTSMACPHVAAAAVLIKSLHPTWSPAAIKSALMTTANLVTNVRNQMKDERGNLSTPFSSGSGHIRPWHASDPGLVYDTIYRDYAIFMCNKGKSIDPSIICPADPPSPSNLNYPSISVANLTGSITVTRTVTNVANKKSVYYPTIVPPKGVTVTIEPEILTVGVGEKKDFTVTLKAEGNPTEKNGQYSFGWFAWRDETHFVRSPIVVSFK